MDPTSQNPAGRPGHDTTRTANFRGNSTGFRPGGQGDTARLRDRLSGQWLSVLRQISPTLGLAIDRLGKHVACQRHGGKDGFRLFPDANQTGGGMCNTCGSFPDGFALIMWANGWDFPTTKRALADAVGLDRSMGWTPPTTRTRPPRQTTPTVNITAFDKMLSVAEGVVPFDHPTAGPARLYLINRGMEAILNDLPDPTVFGFHAGLEYWHDHQLIGMYPAIVMRVQNLAGYTVSLHRIYLSPDGHKAAVPEPKKLMVPAFQGATQGAAIQLYQPAHKTLHIAEGRHDAITD